MGDEPKDHDKKAIKLVILEDTSFLPSIAAILKTSGHFISPTSASLKGIITLPNQISFSVIQPLIFSVKFSDEKSSHSSNKLSALERS